MENLQPTGEELHEQPSQDQQPVETLAETTATEVSEPSVEPDPIPEPFQLPVAESPQQPFELTPELVADKFKDNREALLKALGYDDFGINALDYYSKTGDLAAYWEAKSVDYTQMSDEQVMERKLREQYASMNLSDEELALLVEDELSSRFKLNDELASEREMQLGRIKLKAEAAEYRSKLIERQSQFKAPESRAEQASEPQPTYEQLVEAQRQRIVQDASVQQFLQSKVLKMGDGQNPFSFEAKNPQETLAVLYDNNRYTYAISQKDSEGRVLLDDSGAPKLDYGKMLKVAAYVEHMDNIEKLLVEHGRKLGAKSLLDEAENVQSNQQYGAKSEPDSLWKAFERKLG